MDITMDISMDIHIHGKPGYHALILYCIKAKQAIGS